MINIVIIDNDAYFGKLEQQICNDFFNKTDVEYRLTVFKNSCQLLWETIEGKYYDIYLIEIEMPEVDGLTLAQKIRQHNDEAQIIFITTYTKYCVQATEYGIWRYITKGCAL